MTWTKEKPTEPGDYLGQWQSKSEPKLKGGPFFKPLKDFPRLHPESWDMQLWYFGPIPKLPIPEPEGGE